VICPFYAATLRATEKSWKLTESLIPEITKSDQRHVLIHVGSRAWARITAFIVIKSQYFFLNYCSIAQPTWLA
jgi:hypothetical protein